MYSEGPRGREVSLSLRLLVWFSCSGRSTLTNFAKTLKANCCVIMRRCFFHEFEFASTATLCEWCKRTLMVCPTIYLQISLIVHVFAGSLLLLTSFKCFVPFPSSVWVDLQPVMSRLLSCEATTYPAFLLFDGMIQAFPLYCEIWQSICGTWTNLLISSSGTWK